MMGTLTILMVAVVLVPLRRGLLAMEHLQVSVRSEEMASMKAQRLEMMGTLLIMTVAVALVPLKLGIHVIPLLLQLLAL
jgi:hypothetical protein